MLAINERTITVDGKELLVKILNVGLGEGLTAHQLAELLGTHRQNIYNIANRYHLTRTPIVYESVKQLKDAGLLPIRTPSASFYPKASIKILVKIINTPQAWAVYNQLWEIAESKEEAVIHHTALAGSSNPVEVFNSDFLRKVADQMDAERAARAKAEAERDEAKKLQTMEKEHWPRIQDAVSRRLIQLGYNTDRIIDGKTVAAFLYKSLSREFDVPTAGAIPISQVDDAMTYIINWEPTDRQSYFMSRYKFRG